jgi:tetratricopeptide (TPR) repeat protein
VRLNPNHVFSQQNLAWAYLTVGRSDEAEAVCRQALDKGFKSSALPLLLWLIARTEGDEVSMREQVDMQNGTFTEAWMDKVRAEAAIDAGQLREARELGRRAVEVAQRFDVTEMASLFAAQSAAAEAFLSNDDEERSLVEKALGIARSRDAMSFAVMALAAAGAPEATELIAELDERFPQNTLIQRVALPSARAAQAIRRGDPETAIELLEAAAPYERANLWVIYLRGLAYLELDRADEAVDEFRKIDEVRGIWDQVPVRSLAQLGLARALVMSGDTAGARRAYDDLFVNWKDADEGFEPYSQAQAEYAALE